MTVSLRIIFFILCLITAVSSVSAEVLVTGSMSKWQPLDVDVNEPSLFTNESAESPNPFLDIALTVMFTSPDGETFAVPGFFAGDGNGSGSGSVWRARFSPSETGLWRYSVAFRQGAEIAVSDEPTGGEKLPSDGVAGTFEITDIPEDAPGFTSMGRLEYDGHHYLKFADGPYWIKGGVDSPENFFGFAGFDNTLDHSGGVNSQGLTLGVHEYSTHVADWQSGDPEFSNVATGHSGKGIIGAVNYLSEQGVNSIYFLPMNLGGDGRETYPFLGTSGSRSDNTHYDISKLFQWNLVLQHMQNKGIAAHVVLAETENPNTLWLDDGQLGVERKLFYRELVARFSYLLALKWNLSEESRYGDSRHASFANYLRQVDWAQHQIAVHTNRDRVDERYDGLLGNIDFDATSIQYSPERAEEHVETWRKKSADAGWPWVIDMDENSPAGEGLTPTNTDALRRTVLYPVYFSGGNLEWYFGYHDLPLGGDIRTEDFRTREAMFRYTRYAREFMESELPFHQMQPSDDLHSKNPEAKVQVFAQPGTTYALYLPIGDTQGFLTVPAANYTLRWYNPRDGQFKGDTRNFTGPKIEPGSPPEDPTLDWVVLIKKEDSIPDTPNLEGTIEENTDNNNGDNNGDTPNLLAESETEQSVTDSLEIQSEEDESANEMDEIENSGDPLLGAASELQPSQTGALSVLILFIFLHWLIRSMNIKEIGRRR